jgi:hypothetical protein
MRRLVLILAACSPATPAVENHPTVKPAPVAQLAGPRSTIVHSQFLFKPISVLNPSKQPLDVGTATQSIMIVTVPLVTGLSILLASDGKTGGPMGPPDPKEVIVDKGTDATLQWIVMKRPHGFDMFAINLPTGVSCSAYTDTAPQEPDLTRAQVDQLLATCRDIRFATEPELADTAHVFHD